MLGTDYSLKLLGVVSRSSLVPTVDVLLVHYSGSAMSKMYQKKNQTSKTVPILRKQSQMQILRAFYVRGKCLFDLLV